MLPGSKTAPSPTPSNPKQPHTKSASVGNHPSLHSNSLAVMLLLTYKDPTKLSLVNMQLTAYMSALLRKREHICSIAMSIGSSSNHKTLSLRRLRIRNESPLTQIVMMRVSPTLQVPEMLIQRGAR